MAYRDLDEIASNDLNINITPGSGKPWKQQYYINNLQSKDITEWTVASSLPKILAWSQAIVTKNRAYLLGGWSGVPISTVYSAPINDNGTLGVWTAESSLPGPLSHSQAIVTRNRVYLLGGHNGRSATPTVYTAPINSDGTLGIWTIGRSLPEALDISQAIVTRNRVYLLGGWNGSNHISTVYTAPINDDGTLGAWTTGPSLPLALGAAQAIVTRNRVYLLGGWSSNGHVSTVYTASINSDGTLSTWSTGPSLPKPLGVSQAIVTKNRVYLLGGWNSGPVPVVYTASINSNGTLGAWSIGPSLPGALSSSQAIVTRNRVYLLGGFSGINWLSTVYTASIEGGLNDYSAYYSY